MNEEKPKLSINLSSAVLERIKQFQSKVILPTEQEKIRKAQEKQKEEEKIKLAMNAKLEEAKKQAKDKKREETKKKNKELEAKRQKKEVLRAIQAEQRRERFKEHYEMIDYLCATYPKCFTNPPSPLAIGIHTQILEKEAQKSDSPLANEKKVRQTLGFYTKLFSYLDNLMISGALRKNLDGSVSGTVSEENATGAKLAKESSLNRIKEKNK